MIDKFDLESYLAGRDYTDEQRAHIRDYVGKLKEGGHLQDAFRKSAKTLSLCAYAATLVTEEPENSVTMIVPGTRALARAARLVGTMLDAQLVKNYITGEYTLVGHPHRLCMMNAPEYIEGGDWSTLLVDDINFLDSALRCSLRDMRGVQYTENTRPHTMAPLWMPTDRSGPTFAFC